EYGRRSVGFASPSPGGGGSPAGAKRRRGGVGPCRRLRSRCERTPPGSLRSPPFPAGEGKKATKRRLPLPYGGFALIFPKSCSRFPAAMRDENGVIHEDLRRWGRN